MSFSNFQPQFLPFTGKDYDVWAIKMATTLQAHDVWDYVQLGFPEPKDEVAKHALNNAEREQWKKDKKKNAQVINFVNQLNIYGEEIKDQTVVEKVLRSLSTKFDVVVAATEEAKDLAPLTIDELMGSLLSHEVRTDRNKDSTLETAFKSQVSISRDKGQGKSRSRDRGQGRRYGGQRDGREEQEHESGSNYRSFNNNQRVDKSKVRCYYCNKFDHYAHDCNKEIPNQGNQRENVTTKSNNSMFLACHIMHDPFVSVSLLDTSCSNHMKCNNNLVANFDQSVKK
eukprot:PITA_10889